MLERVDETRRAELLERLGRCHDDETSVEYLRAIVANEGGLDEAGRVMQEYIARAVSLLSEYEDSDYRKALIDLCRFVTERNR